MSAPGAEMPGSPSATYRALLKGQMRVRQKRVLLLAALATHALLSAALLSVWAPLRASTLAGTAALLGAVVLPLLLVRRTQLIYHADEALRARLRHVHTSRGARALALAAAAETWRWLALHALLGVLVVLAYSGVATAARGWRRTALAPMVWVPQHGAYFVNETWLLALLLAAVLAALYALAFQVWPNPPRNAVPLFDPASVLAEQREAASLRGRCTAAVVHSVPRALALLALALPPLATYSALRDTLWQCALHVVGVNTPARRFLVPSFRLPYAPVRMLLSTLPALALVLALLAVVHALFDVYWTHPLPPASRFARDPNVALLGGLSDAHPFFASHAFSELVRVAMYDAPRRKMLYDDVQRQHGRPVAWAGVRSACERVLGEVGAQPAGGGADGAPSAPAVPASGAGGASGASGAAPGAARELPPSVWQVLATAPERPQPRKEAPPAPPAPPARASGGALSLLRWALASAWRLVPADAKHALMPAAVQQRVLTASPALQLEAELLLQRTVACWAALALQHLVCASLEEDAYGTVQKDVPGVYATLQRASERLHAVRRRIEAAALELDSALLRELRRSLAHAGGDAAAPLSTAHAPFYTELQHAWHSRYAALESALDAAPRAIAARFARYGVAKPVVS